MNFKQLSLLLYILFLTSCGNPYYKAAKELENTKFDNDPELKTARKAIGFIESNQLDSLISMFPEKIVEAAPNNVWKEVIAKGQVAISNSDFPADSLVEISNTINMTEGKRQIFSRLSFPFTDRATKDSTKYINIITSEKRLYGLGVDDYPFGIRMVEPKHTEPHLDNHSVDYESIEWFRSWYVSGFKNNEFGDSFGYYAVSGNKEKLDKLGIEPVLSDIFELINSAKTDSTDFNHLEPIRNGASEYIYLRFNLNKEPYNNFGEFTIYYTLEEEPGKPEGFSDFIIVKHSKKTRYLYKKENNPELVQKLKELTYKDYGRHQEKRWY